MSLCVSIFPNFPNCNEIIVGADTRQSIKIDGKSYVLDDEFNKLRVVHDKLIFMCGIGGACEAIVESYKNQSDGSIETLKRIAQKVCELVMETNNISTIKNLFLCNFLVFEYDKRKGAPVVTNLHSEDDFTIRTYNYYLSWEAGARCDEAREYISKNIYSMPLDDLLLNIYKAVNCEEIGGKMQVYSVSYKGICQRRN